MTRIAKISTLFIAGGLLLASCSSDDAGNDSDTDVDSTEASQATDGPTTTVTTTTDSEDSETSTTAPAPTDDAMAEGTETVSLSISTAESSLGEILVGEDAMTVYGFVPDIAADEVTCFDACLEAWPPVLVAGEDVPEGLDTGVFSVVEGPEGFQLQAGETPLYYFANDAAAGETTGQGAGDNWYVVSPDGSLIK